MKNIFEEEKESYKEFFTSLPIEMKNYLGLNVTLSKRKYRSIKECKMDLDEYCTSMLRLELSNYYNTCCKTQRYMVSELLKFIESGGIFSYVSYIAEEEMDKKVFSLWSAKNRKGKVYNYNGGDSDHSPAQVHIDIDNLK